MAIMWTEPTQEGVTWPKEQLLPSPFREIDQNEFNDLFHCSSYSPEGYIFHQLFIDGKLCGVSFWQMFGSLLAVAKVYYGDKKNWDGKGVFVESRVTPYGEVYGEALRFFKIGCEHKNQKHVTHAMFDHEDICLDCGWSHRYDSSG